MLVSLGAALNNTNLEFSAIPVQYNETSPTASAWGAACVSIPQPTNPCLGDVGLQSQNLAKCIRCHKISGVRVPIPDWTRMRCGVTGFAATQHFGRD